MKYRAGQFCRIVKNLSGGFSIGTIVKIEREDEREDNYICSGICEGVEIEFYHFKDELAPFKDMKRTISFGKIDLHYNGRKINLVEITLELKTNSEGKYEFSCYADIWNSKHTDCIQCGQCIDDLAEYFPKNKLFNCILALWLLHHLNGVYSGVHEISEGNLKLIEKIIETGEI